MRFFLFPTTIAPAKAAKPALMCTTVPPAKSFTQNIYSVIRPDAKPCDKAGYK
jgi:hypothetical protein